MPPNSFSSAVPPGGRPAKVAFARGCGAILAFLALGLWAGAARLRAQLPTGGTVVAGSASLSSSPGSLTVTAGNNSVLQWSSFNIGAGQAVQFVQPGSASRVLNWIGGLTPSQIDGTLRANGQVYLANSAGVYFGATAVVNVGQLYAIGGSLSKEDFLAGLNRFTGLTGAVRNDGALRGSAVALIGLTVLNTGTIVTNGGFVALGAGNQVLLGRDGSSIYVDTGLSGSAGAQARIAGPGVANTGTIDAGKGAAVLAAGDLYSVAITLGGKLSAHHVLVQAQGGGDVLVSGAIDASSTAAGSVGGSVAISGGRVGLLSGASVAASGPAGGGTILVGGDTHGANPKVPDATDTTIEPGVTLSADATVAGPGGKVVVWSDVDTRDYGGISARGGPLGGDGGSAEVSGLNLVFQGTADLGAPAGAVGSLLLDPIDLTIDDNAANTPALGGAGTLASPFTPLSGTPVLTWTAIFALLNDPGGANVFITTSGSPTAGTGNISVTEGPNAEGNSGAYDSPHALSLTTAAGAGISFSTGANVVNAGAGSITLKAGTGGIALGANLGSAGGVTIDSAGAVAQTAGTLAAGALTLQGAGDFGASVAPIAVAAPGVTLAKSGGNTFLEDSGAVALQGATGGNLSLAAGGAITQSGALSVTGTSNFSAGANPIALTNLANAFTGAVSLSNSGANNVALVDAGNLVLGAAALGGGALNATALGGGIAETGAIVKTGGASTFMIDAGANQDVLLDTQANDFGGGAVTFATAGGGTIRNLGLRDDNAAASLAGLPASANNVDLIFTHAAITLPALAATGSLSVTADGAITQSGALTVTGTSSFDAGANAITLTHPSNALTGAVSLTATGTSGVSVVDSGSLVLGATSLGSGALNATALGGGIVETGAIVKTGGGSTFTIEGGANQDVLLDTQANNFGGGAVTFATAGGGTIRNLGLRDDNAAASLAGLPASANNVDLILTHAAIALPALTAAGNLNVTAGGAIAQSGALTVAGTSSLNAGANPLTLTNPSNALTGAVSLANSGPNNVALTDHVALNLGASSVGSGTLTVNAPGISQTGALVQASGAGAAAFNAGANAIALTNLSNAFTGAVSLSNSGANNVALVGAGNLVLGATSLGGGVLNATAIGGGIAETGGIVKTGGASTFTIDAGANQDVLLDTQANNFGGGLVTLTTSNGGTIRNLGLRDGNAAASPAGLPASANNVDLIFTNAAIALPALTATGSLSVTAGGAITQSGALSVTGTSNFSAGANAITLTNASNALTGAVSLNATGMSGVSVVNSGSLVLGAASLGSGALNATALGGGIAETGAIVKTGGASTFTINAGANQDLLLDTQANNFGGGPVTFTTSNGGTIRNLGLRDDNAAASLAGLPTSANNIGLIFTNAAIALPALTATGSLNVMAGGAISQTGALTVAGASNFSAGANAITLTNAANALTGAVSLANSGAGNVALADEAALVLGPSAVGAGTLTLTAVGISQTGPVSQAAGAGAVTLTAGAGAIALSNPANDFTGSLSLHNSGANSAAVTDAGSLFLVSSSVGQNLTLAAGSSIEVTGTIAAGGTQDYQQAVTLGGATTLSGTSLVLAGALGGAGQNLTLEFSGDNPVNGAVITGVGNLATGTGVTTLTGSVTTSGTQTYTTPATLAGDATLTGTNLSLGSTLTGAGHSLTLQFSGGDTVNGSIITGVANLTTGAGATTLTGSIATTGAQTYHTAATLAGDATLTGTQLTLGSTLAGAGHSLNLEFSGGNPVNGAAITGLANLTTGAGATTLAGPITTSGTQTYNTPVTLSGDTALTGTVLTLGGTLTGAGHNLNLEFSGGDTVNGAIVTGVGSLTTGVGATTLTGPITTSGTQTYHTPVTLTGDTILTGTQPILGSTLAGAGHNLDLEFSGGNTVNGSVITGIGNLTTGSGPTTLTGAITTSGTQTYHTAATLAGDTSLTGTVLTVASTLAGAGHNLNLEFSGGDTVDGTLVTGVGNLATGAGPTTLTGPIATSGTQTYNTAATLAGDTSLAGTVLTLGATLAGAGHNLDLEFSGGDTVNGSVITGVGNLATGAGLTTLTGAVTTSGTQAYHTAVTLAGDTTLTGTVLSLGGSLAGAGHDLNLEFSGGNVVDATVISGVRNLATGVGPTTLTGAVTTSGTQTYHTAATLSGDTTLTGTVLTLGSTLAGAGHNLDLEFSGGDTVNGSVITGVGNLTTGVGATTLTGPITTSGTQTYHTAATLSGDTTLTGTVLTLGSTLAGAGHNLNLEFSGGETVDGAVITGLGNLATGAGPTTLTGTITTTGSQSYARAATLSGDTTLATADSPVSFGGTVDSGGGGGRSLTILTGASGPTFGGAVGAAPGGALGTLTVTNAAAAGLALPAVAAQALTVTTAGPVTALGALAIGGAAKIDAGASPIALGAAAAASFGSLELTGGNVSVTQNSGDLRVTAATAGSLALAATKGGVEIDQASVSATLPPPEGASAFTGALQVNSAAGVSFGPPQGAPPAGGAVTAASLQVASEGAVAQTLPVLIGGAASLNADGHDITLGAPQNEFNQVTIAGHSIVLEDAQPIFIQQLAATGDVAITTAGSAEFIAPLAIGGKLAVTAGPAGVSFDQALDGNTTAADVTVTTSGPAAFAGAVGGGGALRSLTVAGGATTLGGGVVDASGAVSFAGPVSLGRDTTFTASSIDFGGTVRGAANGGQAAVLVISGSATFQGAVGDNNQALSSLTTEGGAVALDADAAGGPTVTTTGAQTYNSALVLQQNAGLLSTGGGNVTFGGTVDGPFGLAVGTSGAATFHQPVGGSAPLASLALSNADGATVFAVAGSTLTSPTVATTGAQAYANPVTLQQDTVLASADAGTAASPGGIAFSQAVSGPGFAFRLSAPQATITTLQDLGSPGARLGSVSENGADLVVGGNIWAQGNIALGIGAANGDSGNDFIQLNGGSAPANTRLDSAAGAITLGSGAAGSPLKTGAPLSSSIFKSNLGDLDLFASSITVEPFERVAVSGGSLVAVADGTAAGAGITLSNTAVANYLVLATANVNGPSIFLESRPPADVLPTEGTVPVLDQGTDLVAGAVLFFNARFGAIPTRSQFAPTPTPSTDPAFFNYAAQTGNVLAAGGPLVLSILPESGGTADPVFVADLLSANNFRPVVPNLAYLDLATAPGFAAFQNGFIGQPTFGLTTQVPLRVIVSTGAQTRETLEDAFIPDVPRQDEEAPAQEADLSAGVREQLQALGIYARTLLPAERKSRGRRAGLFLALPEKEHPKLSDYEVADARVEDRAVREVIRLAAQAGLLGGGQRGLEEVAAALAASFEAFSAVSPTGSAPEFKIWLQARHDSDATRVLQYAALLSETLKQIELLGLTRQELEGSKAQIYGSVLSSRLHADPEFLRAFIEDLPTPKPVALLDSAAAVGSLAASNP